MLATVGSKTEGSSRAFLSSHEAAEPNILNLLLMLALLEAKQKGSSRAYSSSSAHDRSFKTFAKLTSFSDVFI
jgi:hypothetical protein